MRPRRRASTRTLAVCLPMVVALAGSASAQTVGGQPGATTAPAAPANPATPAPAAKPWRLFEAIGSPAWLKFGLDQRTRFEGLQNDFRAASIGNDENAVSMRTLFTAELKYKTFVLGGEFEDSRAYSDQETPLNNTIVDAVELLQAYLAVRDTDLLRKGDAFSATMGRMTIDVGSRRLVARNEFRNTINQFTGLDLQWTSPSKHFFRVFGVMPVLRQPTDQSSLEDNDVEYDEENQEAALWTAFYGSPPLFAATQVEGYVIGYDEKDTEDAPSNNRHLVTPGFRLLRVPAVGKFDWQLEAMFQFGKSRASTAATDTDNLDHEAYSLHASTGYKFDAPWTPRLLVQYDLATGDDSPTDGENNRFDRLFGARRFEFGPTSIYGAIERSNINTPGLRLEIFPLANVDGFICYRAAWLESDQDAWTTAGLRDVSGDSGSFIGHQIEGRLRWFVYPKNLALEIGGAYLDKGEFATDAPGSSESSPIYFYTQMTVTI